MPGRDYREVPLTFERGLIEHVEPSMAPPGTATELQNWEPEPGGNLRVRRAWKNVSVAGLPASPWKCRGIGYFSRDALLGLPEIVQKTAGSIAASGQASATWPAATTAGSLLVAIGTASASAALATDDVLANPTGPGAPWVRAVVKTDNGGNDTVTDVWYIENAGSRSGAETWTGHSTGTTSSRLHLYEVKNIAASGALDKTNSNQDEAGLTTLTTGSTGVLSSAAEFVVAGFSQADTNNVLADWTSPTDGFTQDFEGATANHGTHGTLSKVTIVTDALNPGVTTSDAGTSENWTGAVASFKAASNPGSGLNQFILAAHDTGTAHNVLAVDLANLTTDTWESLSTDTVSGSTDAVAFALGNGHTVFTSARWPLPRKWAGSGTATTITGAPAGRCAAFHKDRIFIGGTSTKPTRLYFSALGTVDSWNQTEGTGDYIEVGKDDGEPIEDIVPFSGTLIIGKRTSLWVLTGSGPESFNLVMLSQGGVAAGRSLKATPLGVFAVSPNHIYLISGGSVDIVSDPVESSYAATGTYVTASYFGEKLYVCDQGSGKIVVLNTKGNLGTWHTEAVADGAGIVFDYDKFQFVGSNSSTTRLLRSRRVPAESRTGDESLATVYAASTPEMWLVGPEEKMTPRWLFLKLRQRGGTSGDVGLTVTPTYDGEASAARTEASEAGAPKTLRRRVDLGDKSGISSVKFRFTQDLDSGVGSAWEIEEAVLGYYVESVR